MKAKMSVLIVAVALLALPLAAQETPQSIVEAYDALADTILSVRAAESTFVAAMLDGHGIIHCGRCIVGGRDDDSDGDGI